MNYQDALIAAAALNLDGGEGSGVRGHTTPKKGSYKVATAGGHEERSGLVLGDYGASKEGSTYKFTHLPSGLAVSSKLPGLAETRAHAIEHLQHMHESGPWGETRESAQSIPWGGRQTEAKSFDNSRVAGAYSANMQAQRDRDLNAGARNL